MWETLCNNAAALGQIAEGNIGDAGTLGGSGLALVLAAVWVFARVVRRIVGLLFMACVVYLVAKTCWGVDLTTAADFVKNLWGTTP